MDIRSVTIDGKPFEYTNQTVFLVETGFRKGSYQKRRRTDGRFLEAWRAYCCYNIGNGGKKRLRAIQPDGKVVTLARYAS